MTSGGIEIIAHRGFSASAPENTLSAVERAIAAGADAIEWDVHVTADGTPVVIHDETLERTTNGAGAVAERTIAELRGLDAGGWFGAEFAGEPIPTLAEALERTKGRVARVYTELKGVREPPDVDRIVDLVRDAGRIGDNVFISIDWSYLERVRARDGSVVIGYIVVDADHADEGIARAAADPRAILDFDYRLLLADPVLARRALARGVPLAVWTVNEAAYAERLRRIGVTGFTTNRVDALLAWRAAARKPA